MTEFLLMASGEGPTDIGDEYAGELRPGPMLKMIQIELRMKHEIDCGEDSIQVIHKHKIVEESQNLRRREKHLFHFGKKWPRDCADFRVNVQVFGILAIKAKASVAVFFRDCDRSRSTPHNDWKFRVLSIEEGFEYSGYDRGVAMAPNPVSEVWLLALLCDPPNAPSLEKLPGNDKSRNHPKKILAREHGISDREGMNALVENKYHHGAIPLPSFQYFEQKLGDAVERWRQASG
ncbi:MAG: hypothetical protein NTX50_09140 [Candidatus Sumerlaeota bacterium]|nr:hypothetical protein [Candidatus Sumerlaeota bacterium]